MDSRKTLAGELIIIILIAALCLPCGQHYAKTPGPTHSVLSLLTCLSVPFIGTAIEAEGEESDLREVKKWWLWVLNQFFLGNPDSPQCVHVCVCAKYV